MLTPAPDDPAVAPGGPDALGAFPVPPGSLTAPPGPAAAQRWLVDAERWASVAESVVGRLDDDAAAATTPDAFSADVVLAVTLTRTVGERLDAVADALGRGEVSALGALCHGRAPVGPNLTGASGGFAVAEAAGLLLAVVQRLTAAVAADAVVASGTAGTLGTLRDRIVRLGRVARASGLVVDADAWLAELDAAVAAQDPATIRRTVGDVARRVGTFEAAVARVADDQQRTRAATADATEVRARAVALRARVLPLAAEVAAKVADPPRLGVPDPERLGPLPEVPTTADPGGWAARADAAEAHLERARRVVAALETAEDRFRGALEARDALRGLLGASRDRQLTRSGGPQLDDAYRAAHDALWVAPCDLEAARALVEAYVDAVRAATPPTPSPTPSSAPAGGVAGAPPASAPFRPPAGEGANPP